MVMCSVLARDSYIVELADIRKKLRLGNNNNMKNQYEWVWWTVIGIVLAALLVSIIR
jgi:hypothetical protein